MSEHEQQTIDVEQQPPSHDGQIVPRRQQRCAKCGAPFSPRRASGGSPQKYCSDECRKISNRERQRTQRIASYAGPTTLPASGPAYSE